MITNNATTHTLELRRKRSSFKRTSGNILKNIVKPTACAISLPLVLLNDTAELDYSNSRSLFKHIGKSVKSPYKGIKNIAQTTIKNEKKFIAKELHNIASANIDSNIRDITNQFHDIFPNNYNYSSNNQDAKDQNIVSKTLKNIQAGERIPDIEKAYLIDALNHYDIVDQLANKLGATDDTQEAFKNKIWTTLGLPATNEGRQAFVEQIDNEPTGRIQRIRQQQQDKLKLKTLTHDDIIAQTPFANSQQIEDVKKTIDQNSTCPISIENLSNITNPVVLRDKQQKAYQLYELSSLAEALNCKPENPITREPLTFDELMNPKTPNDRILFRINKEDFINHTITNG